MKNTFIVAVILCLAACTKTELTQKEQIANNASMQARKSSPPQLYSFTFIVYDRYHKDSCLIQYPENYDSTKRYPLLIYFHGHLVVNNLPYKYFGGLVNLLMQHGLQVPDNFITICPKDNDGLRTSTNIDFIVEYAKKTWAVDSSKIYMTGASVGALNIADYLTDARGFTNKIAAVAILNMIPPGKNVFDNLDKFRHTRIYAGIYDSAYFKFNKTFSSDINKSGGHSWLTPFEGDHSCCNQNVYDPTNTALTPNIYDWLNQYTNQ